MPSKSTPLTKVFVWNESFDLFKILCLWIKSEKIELITIPNSSFSTRNYTLWPAWPICKHMVQYYRAPVQCNTIANSLASHYTHKCLVCSALILLSEEKISDLRVNKACHKTDGGCSSSTASCLGYTLFWGVWLKQNDYSTLLNWKS